DHRRIWLQSGRIGRVHPVVLPRLHARIAAASQGARMTPLMVFAYNHPSQKAAIYAELDTQGVVTFAIQAAQDSPIRGTELFRRMMIAFGDDAKAILGGWTKGDDPSINIDEVNRLTGQGMSLEDEIGRASCRE